MYDYYQGGGGLPALPVFPPLFTGVVKAHLVCQTGRRSLRRRQLPIKIHNSPISLGSSAKSGAIPFFG